MKLVALFISLLLFANSSAQKSKQNSISWLENGRGKSDEIVTPDVYSYFKKGKLFYHLSNDAEKIMLRIRIKDPGIQLRILKQGMIIWISMDGKPDRKMGIHFPVGSQNVTAQFKSDMPSEILKQEDNLISFLPFANNIELIGFSGDEGKRFPSANTDNFRGNIGFDSEGALDYKLIMPFTKLPLRNSKDVGGTMPITLGIEYGPVPARSGYSTILLWIKNIKLATDK